MCSCLQDCGGILNAICLRRPYLGWADSLNISEGSVGGVTYAEAQLGSRVAVSAPQCQMYVTLLASRSPPQATGTHEFWSLLLWTETLAFFPPQIRQPSAAFITLVSTPNMYMRRPSRAVLLVLHRQETSSRRPTVKFRSFEHASVVSTITVNNSPDGSGLWNNYIKINEFHVQNSSQHNKT